MRCRYAAILIDASETASERCLAADGRRARSGRSNQTLQTPTISHASPRISRVERLRAFNTCGCSHPQRQSQRANKLVQPRQQRQAGPAHYLRARLWAAHKTCSARRRTRLPQSDLREQRSQIVELPKRKRRPKELPSSDLREQRSCPKQKPRRRHTQRETRRTPRRENTTKKHHGQLRPPRPRRRAALL